jgi:hypothetical protein
MTRIGAIRFTIGPPRKGASDFSSASAIRLEAHPTLAPQRGIRLSKSAHPREAITYMMEGTVCREPNAVSDLAPTTSSFLQMETGVPA